MLHSDEVHLSLRHSFGPKNRNSNCKIHTFQEGSCSEDIQRMELDS